MSLSQLIQLAPPPTKPIETGSPKGWEEIQQRLGTSLPEDYKTFIDHYGTGIFNDFIAPYNPFSQNEYLNTFQVLDAHHQASHHVRSGQGLAWSIVQPFELYPAPGGLLPWGTTSTYEDVFFWQVSGSPGAWPTIFYKLRNGEYEVWKLTFTSFLVRLFSHEINPVLLHKGFPPESKRIVFHQLEGSYHAEWESG